jgi:Protein of unknown function (DUF3159)
MQAGRPVDAQPDREDDEVLPSFSEQMAEQLGGVRGLVESSIPVTVFVVVNFVGDHFHLWKLNASLIAAVAVAVVMAVYRLSRQEPVRHAVNGVFGVAIGAAIAWNSGEARDFYLPGILLSAAYGIAMLGSVAIRRPLVGWVWAIMADGGGTRWRDDGRLLRVFGWLTVLWAGVYLAKVCIQYALYLAQQTDLLGVTRLVLGWPPYVLLAAITVWVVRRTTRAAPGDQGQTGVI